MTMETMTRISPNKKFRRIVPTCAMECLANAKEVRYVNDVMEAPNSSSSATVAQKRSPSISALASNAFKMMMVSQSGICVRVCVECVEWWCESMDAYV